jgi:5-methylthioadenosine/S-adenosylhomocysteine deaminase
MNDEDIYTFSLLSFYESLLNGVTTVHDMYFRTDVIIKARQAAQINLMTTVTLMDADGKIAGEKRLANFATIVRRYPQELFSVGLHGLYTCSLPYIKKCLAKAKQLNYQLIHLHFCENDQEVRDIKRRFLVKNPSDVLVKYFKSFQLVLAHCVCLNTTDYLNLQKLNVSVVHNPISNAQLGCGFADIVKLIQHKINVCIGTDGQGSGVNLNVIEAVKYAVLIAKSLHKNPCVLDAYDALKLITINAAQALGLSACKGSISVGKDADLVIYQFQNLQMYPINDPIADIVYNSTSADIQSVFVNGKMVINQQKHLTINRDKLLKKCEKLQTILLHKSHSK